MSLNKDSNQVTLMTNSYLPAGSNDDLGAIEMGFSALGNMVDTITYNIRSLESGNDRLYQRGAWTYRLNVKNRNNLKNQLKKLLEETDAKARVLIKKQEENFASSDQITAGISLFYFEEPQ